MDYDFVCPWTGCRYDGKLRDRVVPDVGIRVMNEHTGLRVAVGVDVEIVPPSGDAAADILAVVLEIHRVELDVAVVRTDLTDPVDHVPALLHRRHQIQPLCSPISFCVKCWK